MAEQLLSGFKRYTRRSGRWSRAERSCGYPGRVRRQKGGVDGRARVIVNPHDQAAGLTGRRAGSAAARVWRSLLCRGKDRRMPVAEGREQLSGGRIVGFTGREAGLTAGSWVDSHEIRGLCFLYSMRQPVRLIWISRDEYWAISCRWGDPIQSSGSRTD